MTLQCPPLHYSQPPVKAAKDCTLGEKGIGKDGTSVWQAVRDPLKWEEVEDDFVDPEPLVMYKSFQDIPKELLEEVAKGLHEQDVAAGCVGWRQEIVDAQEKAMDVKEDIEIGRDLFSQLISGERIEIPRKIMASELPLKDVNECKCGQREPGRTGSDIWQAVEHPFETGKLMWIRTSPVVPAPITN